MRRCPAGCARAPRPPPSPKAGSPVPVNAKNRRPRGRSAHQAKLLHQWAGLVDVIGGGIGVEVIDPVTGDASAQVRAPILDAPGPAAAQLLEIGAVDTAL